jgi:5-methylcytosine-specific restriction protein A
MLLDSEPYQERQFDSQGNLRSVWMFPIRLIEGNKPVVDAQVLDENYERQLLVVQKASEAELKRRALAAPSKIGKRQVYTYQYQRDPWVAVYAKARANGMCQLCMQKAPFTDKKGRPFLEAHHIRWLSDDGLDTPKNTVALCPNCHRKMHALNLKDDQNVLLLRARA